MRKIGIVLAVGLALCVGMQAHAAKKKVTVAADGSGDYKTVQAAVDAAPDAGEVIRIKPGVYKELINVPKNGIEMRGLGKQPQDVVLSWHNSHTMAGGTGKSASITVSGDDFIAENLTMENTYEKDFGRRDPDSQAVALLVTGDREVFRHIRLLGFQDTLYANSKLCHDAAGMAANNGGAVDTKLPPCQAARQYFTDCYIEGHVDFIFGDGLAYFDHCELHGLASRMVTFTAQSKLYPSEKSGYVFNHCTITAAEGAKEILFGRPWRAYSTVYFLNTNITAPLDPAGWQEWAGKLVTSSYGEYHSTGIGADTSKRIGSHQLTDAEAATMDTPKKWLGGTDGWNPEKIK